MRCVMGYVNDEIIMAFIDPIEQNPSGDETFVIRSNASYHYIHDSRCRFEHLPDDDIRTMHLELDKGFRKSHFQMHEYEMTRQLLRDCSCRLMLIHPRLMPQRVDF